MHKDKRERFKELCELAEAQEDAKKLGKIAKEIDSILDSELMRLKTVTCAVLAYRIASNAGGPFYGRPREDHLPCGLHRL